ncbi:MAG: hypothetical protein AB1486_01895 [Planctomycetota bacterium]
MRASLPVRRYVLLTGAGAAMVFAALCELGQGMRDRVEDRLQREGAPSDVLRAGSLAARVWPDPVRDTWLTAYHALRDESASENQVIAALQQALQESPRSSAPHFYLARSYCAKGDTAGALREQRRASRCDPFHGLLQLEIARDQLVQAVESGDDPLLEEAARHFAVAVEVGETTFAELLLALEAGGAPTALFEKVAAGNRDHMRALVEHCALAGRHDEALRLGEKLDAASGEAAAEGRVLAHLRVAAALRQAGESERAVEHFARAEALSRKSEAFALDYADALLATGRTAAGITHLITAVRHATLTPARIAGSLLEAADPRAAIRGLVGEACREGAAIARLGALEAARRLGDESLLQAVSEQLAPFVDRSP